MTSLTVLPRKTKNRISTIRAALRRKEEAGAPVQDEGLRIVRVREAAKRLGCSSVTIRRYVALGLLEGPRLPPLGKRLMGISSTSLDGLVRDGLLLALKIRDEREKKRAERGAGS